MRILGYVALFFTSAFVAAYAYNLGLALSISYSSFKILRSVRKIRKMFIRKRNRLNSTRLWYLNTAFLAAKEYSHDARQYESLVNLVIHPANVDYLKQIKSLDEFIDYLDTFIEDYKIFTASDYAFLPFKTK